MTAPFEQIVAAGGICGALLVVALITIRALHQQNATDRATLLASFAVERAALLKDFAIERAAMQTAHEADREAWRRELAAERAARGQETSARIQDSKDSTSVMMRVQQSTIDAVDKIYEIVKIDRHGPPRGGE